ncbi:hypothetical protein WBG78_20465 [Chryseolinea sp. T2]|uniref:hypothetical protein n=1 Tax=Chryseolinea sp. T2 TaxID=3129255 RepID=UPI003076A3F9
MKCASVIALTMLGLSTSCDGQNKTGLAKADKPDAYNMNWKIGEYRPPNVHTETSAGGITIQNSYPKGDAYEDSNGKKYGVAVFWSRVINETSRPLEFKINFSADTVGNLSSPDVFIKLFLPADTMSLDKTSLYGYGIDDLRTFLDHDLNKPTGFERIIEPGGECPFYVLAIREQIPNVGSEGRRPGLHPPNGGVTRTALVLEGKDLFYKVSIGPNTALIPCGQINIRN